MSPAGRLSRRVTMKNAIAGVVTAFCIFVVAAAND